MAETIDLTHSIRRALARAAQGKTLNLDEATALLHARGQDLERLCTAARQVREAAHGDDVSFSKKVFIPLTRLCRDRCSYCTFATSPDRTPVFLTPEEAVAIARAGASAGCKEALFTLGDRPEARYPEARAWLAERGYESTLDYVRAVAIRVIEETGLLPHLNPGVMSYEEMARLKPVSASMGLMLETSSQRLFSTPGEAHYGSPDKRPDVRMRCIEDAGRLAIPFTTGILIGIGETLRERAESLFAIRDVAKKFGHIQEVIVQNFRAKPGTGMEHHAEPDEDEYLAAIAVARLVIEPRVTVQAPPNLSDERYPRLLDAGIDDWGGVSPVTPDHVNPEKPWPQLDALRQATGARGLRLRERLCIYPPYAVRRDPWLSGRMVAPVAAVMGGDGYAADRSPSPVPWQDPDVAPHAASIQPGPSGVLRADSAVVHGNWEMLEVDVSRAWASRRTPPRTEVLAALSRARDGVPVSDADALTLFEAEGADLEALCATADEMRAADVGDLVTYVVNRNINFTNVCYVGCRFCAFAQRRDDPEAYTLSLDEVGRRAREALALGATEVCLQGGIHPDLPGDIYFRIVRTIKAVAPSLHIHAFSPMEVMNGATRLGISYREWLQEAKAAGLGTIPGTAAEILDDEVRWILTKGKLPAGTWEDIVRTAHGLGIRSTSTIMFGHVDAPPHWVAHLRRLRRIQEDTGGFTEFVPLPFVHYNAPIYLAGKARPGPTSDDNRRMHAIARLLLRPVIRNVQVSWVKMGVQASKTILCGGANDFGGTLQEETISRMAGSQYGVAMEVEQFHRAIREIGRIPAERSTTYDRIAPAPVAGPVAAG